MDEDPGSERESCFLEIPQLWKQSSGREGFTAHYRVVNCVLCRLSQVLDGAFPGLCLEALPGARCIPDLAGSQALGQGR